MNKQIFLIAAAAALTLSSCSNDELIQESENQAIGFDAFVNKTTRAADTQLSNLSIIDVWGYYSQEGTFTPVFNKQKVQKSGTAWTYTPLQYWLPSRNYFFTAIGFAGTNYADRDRYFQYADHDSHASDPANFHGCGSLTFDQTYGIGNADMVYAYATKTTSDVISATPGMVDFNFKHALSRVHISFTNNMGSDSYTIKISDLKITNATATAKLTFGTAEPVWSEQSGATEITFVNNLFTPTDGSAANNAKAVAGNKFLIPGIATLKIDFKVELIANGVSIGTYTHSQTVLPETTLEAGKSYNFAGEINPENINPDQQLFPIEFTVTKVDAWVEAPDIENAFGGDEPAAE